MKVVGELHVLLAQVLKLVFLLGLKLQVQNRISFERIVCLVLEVVHVSRETVELRDQLSALSTRFAAQIGQQSLQLLISHLEHPWFLDKKAFIGFLLLYDALLVNELSQDAFLFRLEALIGNDLLQDFLKLHFVLIWDLTCTFLISHLLMRCETPSKGCRLPGPN